MSTATISQQLRAWALEAGFTRAGLASLEPSRHGDHLQRWLDQGYHAGMEWMSRRTEIRENPAQLLPGARSVLCVALQYFPLEGQGPARGDLWPKVARYARGRDYHDIMGRQLKALAERIRSTYPDCATRPYVDTGPILERELAARAGLGAVGKNTNLLHRDGGSYFLLGELLLTLEIVPDDPITDLCGRCTRCLEACPTDALTEPYRLDSRRCISYWTIEHRGSVPRDMREHLGEWVFGCDICQEVCPWNHRPQPGNHPQLELPPERAELDLTGLLDLDRDEYVARFRKSPMKRAKLSGLRRNAAVAMGNRRQSRYFPALERALDDSEPVVRGHTAWALGRIGGKDARNALGARRLRESDQDVLNEIDAALAKIASTAGC